MGNDTDTERETYRQNGKRYRMGNIKYRMGNDTEYRMGNDKEYRIGNDTEWETEKTHTLQKWTHTLVTLQSHDSHEDDGQGGEEGWVVELHNGCMLA